MSAEPVIGDRVQARALDESSRPVSDWVNGTWVDLPIRPEITFVFELNKPIVVSGPCMVRWIEVRLEDGEWFGTFDAWDFPVTRQQEATHG